MPRLSIITRTINRPVLLERALKSVLAQSFTDWQWVVVAPDPDASVAPLLSRYGHEIGARSRLLQFASSVPGMRGQPLNHAIASTESELITVLDDDDTWDPSFLERMIRSLDQPPTPTVAGVVCQSLCQNESSVEDGLAPLDSYVLNAELRGITLAQLAVVNRFCTHAFVYRRSALEKTGLYPDDYPVLEDWHFNLRFALHWDIAVIPEVLTTYHLRPAVEAGAEANSQHAELDLHKFFESHLINEYLRQDLAAGRAGLGHILATAAQARAISDRLHRIEGKVRTMSDKVGKIDSRTREMKGAAKG